MNEPKMDPRKQFSKWLARIGAIFWVIYLPMLLVLVYLRPEVALVALWLTIVVTVNKAIDTLAYTDNSKTEKILHHLLDKLRLTLSLKGAGGLVKVESEDEDEEDVGRDTGDGSTVQTGYWTDKTVPESLTDGGVEEEIEEDDVTEDDVTEDDDMTEEDEEGGDADG